MKQELESQLAKVIEKALQVAESTGEFVIDQAPELLREFYNWHIVEHSITILFCIILILISFFAFRKLGRSLEWDFEDELVLIFGAIGYTVITLVSLWGLFNNIAMLLKLIVAPKIYLIEHFIN